jgi:hypothetical protein
MGSKNSKITSFSTTPLFPTELCDRCCVNLVQVEIKNEKTKTYYMCMDCISKDVAAAPHTPFSD